MRILIPQDDENYLYLDETGSCIESCSASTGGYKLVYKINRKCVKKYDQRFFDNEDKYVSSFPPDRSYIYQQNYSELYLKNLKYYIISESGEQNRKIYCYNDFPLEYQFYVKEKYEK